MRFGSRRLGQFKITGPFIVANPGAIKKIMGECIIIRAEQYAAYDAIHYMAISDQFEECERGHEVPWYTGEVELEEDGITTSFKFKKEAREYYER